MTKMCKECKQEKPETEFYKDKASPGGYRKNCKRCKDAKTVKWRNENREHYNKIARDHNAKSYPKTRLNRYGITQDDLAIVNKAQNNRCGICGRKNTSKKREFATDHHHPTKIFRGVLCYKCNRDMNLVDDPIQLAKCLAYRDKIRTSIEDTVTTTKVKIVSYPTDFEFVTNIALPKFISSGTVGVDYDCEMCEVRNQLLHINMKLQKINSPCHAYEDYVVEVVTKTEDGEIWRLGS